MVSRGHSGQAGNSLASTPVIHSGRKIRNLVNRVSVVQ